MAIDHASLWNKSKMLLDRAIRARDDDRDDDFQLWAALALEVLGKARLAKIHPALVVDPNKTESLMVACGLTVTCELRTITASAVFSRCLKTVPGFDKTCHDFASRMTEDRNAHLHSGAVPFADAEPEGWQNKFWTIVNLMVDAQGRTLEELIGPAEAEAARKIIADARATLEVGIERRIAKYRKAFESRPADEQRLRASAAEALRARLEKSADNGAVAVECPACGNPGRLSGELVHQEPGEDVHQRSHDDEFIETSWLRWVDCSFASDEFECSACGLGLHGLEELEAAEIPGDYDKSMIMEWSEAEYGND